MPERKNDGHRSVVKPLASSQCGLGPAHRRRILSVSKCAADHNALRSALNDKIWQVEEAANYQQAIACLCCERVDVVVCESHLPDGTWKDLLGHIAAIPDPPALIVSSATSGDHLDIEVHNLGGHGVLSKPFNAQEAQEMLAFAWQARAAGSTFMSLK